MNTYNTKLSTIAYDPSTCKYSITYDGKTIQTTLTDKAAVVDQWVTEILSSYANKPAVVGLDVEWRPHPVQSMTNKSATLQLCIDDRCLILQLFYMDEIPQSLKGFLADPNFTFVGIEVADDIAKIKNEYGLVCSSSADIKGLANLRWRGKYRRSGLKKLAWQVVGLVMEKPKVVCLRNWDDRVLTEAQVAYACIDAYASYRIGHYLLMELDY